jgi:hypothetical protein
MQMGDVAGAKPDRRLAESTRTEEPSARAMGPCCIQRLAERAHARVAPVAAHPPGWFVGDYCGVLIGHVRGSIRLRYKAEPMFVTGSLTGPDTIQPG